MDDVKKLEKELEDIKSARAKREKIESLKREIKAEKNSQSRAYQILNKLEKYGKKILAKPPVNTKNKKENNLDWFMKI